MLESLTIKNIASFNSAGVKIDGLKKINFIYGANGSGKTSLTKLIYNSDDPTYVDCSLNWRGGFPVKALVYNKDFRERNFGKGKIEGVFTLGQATKEDIDAIEKMQNELELTKIDGIKKREMLDKQILGKNEYEEEFKEVAWSKIYKENEIVFKEGFTGYMKKDTFKEKILIELRDNKDSLLTKENLTEKAEIIFGKKPTAIPTLTIIEFSRLLEIEVNGIWKKKIIGKSDVSISALIQKLNLNDWVNEGRTYIQENKICPFCQQETITQNFRKELEDYFDESFTQDSLNVKSLFEEYIRLSQNLLNLLQQIESTENINPETKLKLESFSALIKTLNSQLVSNKELLNSKIKEPSRSIELISVKEQLESIKKLITEGNDQIQKHNNIVSDYTNQRSILIKAIWKFLIEGNRSTIETFLKRVEGMEKAVQSLNKQCEDLRFKYSALDKKIKEGTKNVTSVQPSVDEINHTLKSYGFLNFLIVPSKIDAKQYQIQRQDGTVAEATLSDGESTFITFLYFLQLTKGSTQEDAITEERILVIDDPISSLDSNVLFVVSSLIKKIISGIKENKGNIKQLLLLTHNVYFHKEVSFINGRTKSNSDTNFWILRRNNNVSSIQAFGLVSPIQNSYELLWRELNQPANNSSITIQNIMRRIIENYFKILGRYTDDNLILSFANHQDQEICRSLVCWINDGSHSIPDDLYIEQHDTVVEKYFDVFKKIFVQMGHIEHYNMMFRVINQELAILD